MYKYFILLLFVSNSLYSQSWQNIPLPKNIFGIKAGLIFPNYTVEKGFDATTKGGQKQFTIGFSYDFPIDQEFAFEVGAEYLMRNYISYSLSENVPIESGCIDFPMSLVATLPFYGVKAKYSVGIFISQKLYARYAKDFVDISNENYLSHLRESLNGFQVGMGLRLPTKYSATIMPEFIFRKCLSGYIKDGKGYNIFSSEFIFTLKVERK